MTTDFRALCADLADELDAVTGYIRTDGTRITHPDVALARAALSQPEPEPPTDLELMEVFWDHQNELEEIWADDWLATARAVLARWGNYPESPGSSTEPASGKV